MKIVKGKAKYGIVTVKYRDWTQFKVISNLGVKTNHALDVFTDAFVKGIERLVGDSRPSSSLENNSHAATENETENETEKKSSTVIKIPKIVLKVKSSDSK
jgi:hypothetical protein